MYMYVVVAQQEYAGKKLSHKIDNFLTSKLFLLVLSVVLLFEFKKLQQNCRTRRRKLSF